MEYWANVESEKIAEEIIKKVNGYKNYLESSGILGMLRKSYNTFYGDFEINDIDGSLKAIQLNHYASYIRNIHNMVTGQRPAWETQAINTDLKTQADTQLASGLLDYYMREKQIETKLNEAVLRALYLKEGWISLGWNVTGGEVYGVNPETGKPINEGDFEIGGHTLLDVTRDIRKKDMNNDWYILRKFENKWDLAAKYPEHAEKIKNMTADKSADMQYEINGIDTGTKGDDSCDLIPTYTLMHARTEAIPSGRMAKVLANDIKLLDGPLPYKRVYLFPIVTAHQDETAFGHSYMMDLLPVQDAFDATVSAILTNQSANAVNNFQCPKGAAPTVTKIEGGMNIWEFDPKAGKIEVMELLKTAPEVFNFADFLIRNGDLLSNVSQIGRGNAPPTMSGTAMALLQQQAIQSTSGVQTSYTLALESVGSGLIELLQTFAVVPRVALIAGKSKRSMMKEFSNKDLNGIGRVFVNRANPLMKANAGRMEVANNLLNAPQGFISTPEQYLGVLTTGNLEPLYQRDNSQRMNILSENEMLMEGQPVQALLTDNHPTHILEHSCVLDSPDARQSPEVVQVVLNHIQEHMDLAKNLDPALAGLLKQQSIFQPQQPPMPEGQAPQGGPMPSPEQQGEMLPNPAAEQAGANLPSPAQPPNPNAFQGVQ